MLLRFGDLFFGKIGFLIEKQINKPHLTNSYLIKYLQASWTVSEIKHELRAYDIIGKHYFY